MISKYVLILKIQALFRGNYYRKHNLPNSIKYLRYILTIDTIKCSKLLLDGRTNSSIDEENIIALLKQNLQNRLLIPLPRHWFDIAIYDYQYGWLPINIKSTTTKSSDNVGNMTMCVYALTNYKIELTKKYTNGPMSKIFINYLNNNHLNKKLKKDYYFLVINKETNNIIINSLKGLTTLQPNINNLPFQVRWCANKQFKYNNINTIIPYIISTIAKPKPSWSEIFLKEIRKIQLFNI